MKKIRLNAQPNPSPPIRKYPCTNTENTKTVLSTIEIKEEQSKHAFLTYNKKKKRIDLHVENICIYIESTFCSLYLTLIRINKYDIK